MDVSAFNVFVIQIKFTLVFFRHSNLTTAVLIQTIRSWCCSKPAERRLLLGPRCLSSSLCSIDEDAYRLKFCSCLRYSKNCQCFSVWLKSFTICVLAFESITCVWRGKHETENITHINFTINILVNVVFLMDDCRYSMNITLTAVLNILTGLRVYRTTVIHSLFSWGKKTTPTPLFGFINHTLTPGFKIL